MPLTSDGSVAISAPAVFKSAMSLHHGWKALIISVSWTCRKVMSESIKKKVGFYRDDLWSTT